MKYVSCSATTLWALCIFVCVVKAEEQPPQVHLELINQTVKQFCLDCHSSVEPEAGLNLDDFSSAAKFGEEGWNTNRWEKVWKRLQSRQMPPPDAERPSEEGYQKTVAALESVLDQQAELHPQPGRTDSIRRLNRTEYRNAIRDLLSLDVDVQDLLPADELSHGFDNVTVGELSPILLSRYLSAAEKISRLAIGAKKRSPGGVTIRLPADFSQESHVQGLPIGTRGGTLIQHNFPADGEYEIQITLMRDRDEFVEGLSETHELHVLLDRKLIEAFTVSPPRKQQRWERDDSQVDAHLKKRFHISAGPHAVGVTFPRKFDSLLEIRRQPFDANFNKHRHPRRSPAIFQVSIVGPFNAEGPGKTPSRQRVLISRPTQSKDELTAATEVLRPLARLAYRRPVTEDDLEVPLAFFAEEAEEHGFEAGIERALAMILVNPHFLFRAEQTPEYVAPGDAYRISDLELATRLSFFLWSSLPDDELLSLAEAGKLHEPEVLSNQVERMLHDRRSHSLVTNFATQWLYLKNLDNFRPDMRLFPGFDDNLRQAMKAETRHLFASVVRENRSVLDLIQTNTTWLNERLAKHYGIPHVVGSRFRPVKVSSESRRGGLLRHGSILSVTSYATRTSPTVRGNWILENILGTPAPPPPPNVPALQEKKSTESLTVRERLAEHRANPACASCHNLMDPVGFSLENFDAVGRWRNFESGLPIDSSGTLPDGSPANSLEELEQGILARPEMFVGTLTSKLLTFALGRGIEASDGPAIRSIVRQAAEDDYRFVSLVKAITMSTPFQMREAK